MVTASKSACVKAWRIMLRVLDRSRTPLATGAGKEDLTGKLIFNYVLGLTPLQHDHGPGCLADTSSRNKNGIGPPCVRMGAGFVIAAVTCSSG